MSLVFNLVWPVNLIALGTGSDAELFMSRGTAEPFQIEIGVPN